MGILNVTPDSFSDGGRYSGCECSSGPRAKRCRTRAPIFWISAANPAGRGACRYRKKKNCGVSCLSLKRWLQSLTIPISIDTYRSRVAQKADRRRSADRQRHQRISIRSGNAADGARRRSAGIVLMHSRGSREELHRQPPMADPIGRSSTRTAACNASRRQMPELNDPRSWWTLELASERAPKRA